MCCRRSRHAETVYGNNPFPESLRIARYLEDHTTPDQKIAVFGSEPQIYFYAHRHSATGYIYTYPLMEPQPFASQMQTEMIEEIERNRPAYIVFVSMQYSWLKRPDSDRKILDWLVKERAAGHLEVAGLIDFMGSSAATDRVGCRSRQNAVALFELCRNL